MGMPRFLRILLCIDDQEARNSSKYKKGGISNNNVIINSFANTSDVILEERTPKSKNPQIVDKSKDYSTLENEKNKHRTKQSYNHNDINGPSIIEENHITNDQTLTGKTREESIDKTVNTDENSRYVYVGKISLHVMNTENGDEPIIFSDSESSKTGDTGHTSKSNKRVKSYLPAINENRLSFSRSIINEFGLLNQSELAKQQLPPKVPPKTKPVEKNVLELKNTTKKARENINLSIARLNTVKNSKKLSKTQKPNEKPNSPTQKQLAKVGSISKHQLHSISKQLSIKNKRFNSQSKKHNNIENTNRKYSTISIRSKTKEPVNKQIQRTKSGQARNDRVSIAFPGFSLNISTEFDEKMKSINEETETKKTNKKQGLVLSKIAANGNMSKSSINIPKNNNAPQGSTSLVDMNRQNLIVLKNTFSKNYSLTFENPKFENLFNNVPETPTQKQDLQYDAIDKNAKTIMINIPVLKLEK
ncbi:hypothetical protein BB559_005205 [Furculomyces boomerangus]|uniref:Uncharacterized protein n=1 Tax=Furculomyces boomerangus TaxID=61424 RepID=A0A2T9YA32_9FUNG|nr:hypothetical protein BB559_005205 [Furculomyces boomerangus]